MFTPTASRLVFVALLSAVSVALGDSSIGKSSAAPAEQATPTRGTCINHCNAADSKCNSEVRRARHECSKKAASGGRDPFTARNNDYTYFCGYFGNQGRCGSDIYSQGCRNRFARTYGLCVERMYDNIASMRYDCYINERDAQNFCRDELRDCKAVCEQQSQ